MITRPPMTKRKTAPKKPLAFQELRLSNTVYVKWLSGLNWFTSPSSGKIWLSASWLRELWIGHACPNEKPSNHSASYSGAKTGRQGRHTTYRCRRPPLSCRLRSPCDLASAAYNRKVVGGFVSRLPSNVTADSDMPFVGGGSLRSSLARRKCTRSRAALQLHLRSFNKVD